MLLCSSPRHCNRNMKATAVTFVLIAAAMAALAAAEWRSKLHPELREWVDLSRLARVPSPYYVWAHLADKSASSGRKRAAQLEQALQELSSEARSRRQHRGSLPPAALVTEGDLPVDSDYIETIRNIRGVSIRVTSKWLNAVSTRVDSLEALEKLAALPFVSLVELVSPSSKKDLLEMPSTNSDTDAHYDASKEEPRGTEKRGFVKWDYGRTRQTLSALNVLPVHDLGYTGSGITVLVLDSGFNTGHEVFQNLTVIDKWDFVHNDSIVADESGETEHGSHGTSCLGIIAGVKMGSYVGVAPRAKVLLGKTEAIDYEEPIEEDYFVSALEWGEERGADMVSSSLGYHRWWKFPDYNGTASPASRAIDEAAVRGLTVVMAIGNYAKISITTPADAKNAIAVGATDDLGGQRLAQYSSRGPTGDGRIKPEVVAPGSNIHVVGSYNNIYKSNSGTSFATPLVGGIVALLLEAHPTWGPRHVREALIRTASKSKSPNVEFGWGFVDALAALLYEPMVGCDACVHGTCSDDDGICQCEDGYYGANCEQALLPCSSYCVEQGRCAMGRCYCLPSARSDMRCYESGIPGWTCPLESYNDGKECHYSCGIDDPDCRGIKLSDCDAKYQSTKIIPIENLASWCPVGMSKLSSPVDVPSPPTPPPPPQLSTTTSGTSSKSAEPLPLIEGRQAGATDVMTLFSGGTGMLVFVLCSAIFAAGAAYYLYVRRQNAGAASAV